MGTIKVTVDVGTVFPPTPIIVNVDSVDGTYHDSFESDKSFLHNFEVESGKAYIVNVYGTNNEGDETTITVNEDFMTPQTKTTGDPEYACIFSGEVI
ncbi:MAG: hypothetical protein PSV16_09335 [Flavobacterium sp.]|nr:hypothetical protein [Flavobacterium sp.]